MKITVKIHRYWQDENQSFGTCVVLDDKKQPLFASLSLERGWRENQNGVSCIPIGKYPLKLEYSNRFKMDLWEIKNVPNRSETKFHSANYWHQLEGCIALGLRANKLNSDAYMDITASADTIKAFHIALKNASQVELIVTSDKY